MSTALQTPFVAERDDFRLALYAGYATLWVNEQETDVADVLELFLPAAQMRQWTAQAIATEGNWEVYHLRYER